MPTQPPKRNPYGYARKPFSNGSTTHFYKLTTVDREHMKQWRALGFSVAAIARAYDVTYNYTSSVVRGQHK